jgi:hypothetical protein
MTQYHSSKRRVPVINDAYDEETIHALAPSVSNEDRAYNCGRASAILDAKTLLDETMNE